jgi:hypothetical protein
MRENQRLLDEMNKSWEQKLQEAQAHIATQGGGDDDGDGGGGGRGGARDAEARRRAVEPHLLNIHEDPMLSRAVCYFLPPGRATTVGNRASPAGEDLLLGGLSIRSGHCTIANLDPADPAPAEGAPAAGLTIAAREGCRVLVNWKEVAGGGAAVVLGHNDRLCLGTNYCFVVVHPVQAAAGPPEGGTWPEVDWDSLNREVARAQVQTPATGRDGRVGVGVG